MPHNLFINRYFGWEVPNALPMRDWNHEEGAYCWEDWHRDMKAKHPIKYFLLETVPSYFGRLWFGWGMRWYWFQSVTYKKQHLLDLRQPKGSPEEYSYRWGYSDITQRLIYANFNLLCIYIEKELGGIKETKKWLKKLEGYQEKGELVPEFQIKTIREAIALYEWWTIERSKRLAALRTLSDEWHAKRNTPGGGGLLDRNFKAEEAFENEINEKLKSIIDIRQGMWT